MTDIGQLGNNVIEALERLNNYIDMRDIEGRQAFIDLSIGVGRLVAVATGQTLSMTVQAPSSMTIPAEIIEPARGAPLAPDEDTRPVLCGVLKRLGKLVCGCGAETLKRGSDLVWCPTCSHFCGLAIFDGKRIDTSDDRFMNQCPMCVDGEGPAGFIRSEPGGELDTPCPTCALVPPASSPEESE